MGDSFFLAVGTRHIRLAGTDGNTSEIARRIQEAWGTKESKSILAGEPFLIVPLPSELMQFVADFDAGKLGKFEGQSKRLRRCASSAFPAGYGM
jgi:hypothetical protein